MKLILLSALALFGSATPQFAQTPPHQAANYNLVFSEDFTYFDLSPNGQGAHNWYPGIYFQASPPLPHEIALSGSVLDLQWDRTSPEPNTSIESCSYDGSHCNTFRYGYFEARMKWDVTIGSWPAFWMITKQGILGAQHVGELDIFEGQGSDPNHFYGTINEWNGPYQLISTNSPADNRFQLATDNNFADWHTYGLLWVPGRVTWYYDDVAVGAANTPAIFDRQDFFIILGSQEGVNWQGGNLAGATAQSISLNVEWVHVFQLAPGSITPSGTDHRRRRAPIRILSARFRP